MKSWTIFFYFRQTRLHRSLCLGEPWVCET